ncbi:hypothetical protein [Nitrosomonas sp.]|uniref:hypothetical protein n=1 Tax=Nitrosomonas sp. TaxID=42353 RepID=UPI001D7A7A2E|nr:hypothetical protein [Nitrosomonas sp.]MCB1948141.1 hypothetical protein [Nitrosomonas sp.]MCP5242628.1 hypothetical protein [Burkholderiales bacterium]MDR4513370.1 hypothetical protein [Nitrosomonas sp.]
MNKNYPTIIGIAISTIILGVLSIFTFPEANLTFGLVLFTGYLVSTVIYGPAKNYIGYTTKNPVVQG